VPPRLAGLEQHHRQQPRAADSPALGVEDRVRAAALRGKLRAHALRREHRPAARAGRPRARHRAGGHFRFALRLKDLELDARRLSLRALDAELQRPPAARFLAQPQRARERDLRAAVRRLAAHRAGPQVGDGCRAIRVLGVEIREFLLRLLLDLRPHAPQLLRQLRPVTRGVFERHLEDQACDRVEIGSERLAADVQRLERNRAAAGERVHHQRRLVGIRRLHQSLGDLQIGAPGGVVPVGEVRDEAQQRVPQILVGLSRIGPAHVAQALARLDLEPGGAQGIARVGPEQRQQYRAARGERPPRPPQVQRGGVPVPDRLLPGRVPAHLRDGEVDLGEALAGFGDHVRRLGLDSLDVVLDLSMSGLDSSVFMDGSPEKAPRLVPCRTITRAALHTAGAPPVPASASSWHPPTGNRGPPW
jgi:hypothetical protein